MKLHLHRAGKRADWDSVAPERRSFFQRTAARTGGALTPANLISAAGALFVAIGLYDIWQGRVGLGIAEIAVGRIADLLDGIVAQRTHTKSPLGEAVDAALDKLVLFSVLAVFIALGMLPLLPAIGIVILQGITAGITLIGKHRKRPLHPSHTGKISTAVLWIGLLLYGVASMSGFGWLSVVAFAITAGALAGGMVAASQYARLAFSPALK